MFFYTIAICIISVLCLSCFVFLVLTYSKIISIEKIVNTTDSFNHLFLTSLAQGLVPVKIYSRPVNVEVPKQKKEPKKPDFNDEALAKSALQAFLNKHTPNKEEKK